MQDYELTRETVAHLHKLASGFGRKPDVYVQTQFVCKPTRKEAEEYAHYYAVEMADPDAIEYFARQRRTTMSRSTKEGETTQDRTLAATLSGTRPRKFPGMFAGMFPVIGTPDDVVAELAKDRVAGRCRIDARVPELPSGTAVLSAGSFPAHGAGRDCARNSRRTRDPDT